MIAPDPLTNSVRQEKQDIGLVEGHISNMLEVEGLPKSIEIVSNHLCHALDAYRNSKEMRFFITQNPVATQDDVLRELGYEKVENTE